jgi:hypothetical protein
VVLEIAPEDQLEPDGVGDVAPKRAAICTRVSTDDRGQNPSRVRL